MIYFNNDIKKINYQGYDITKVYACGGELVWNVEPPNKFKAEYSDDRVYTLECNSSTTLSQMDVRPSGYQYLSMTSITIGDCVTEIGAEAFRNYYNLVSVELPNSLTKINGRAFMTCRSLTSIDIPSGVTSIGDLAFYTCSGLTSITVHASEPPVLGSMPFHDTNNAPIFVPCESVDSYKSAENWSDYASRIQAIPNSCPPPLAKLVAYTSGETFTIPCDSSTTLTLADVYDGIPSRSQRDAVTSVTIGSCSEVLRERSLNEFGSLTSITIPSTVKSIVGAFYGDVNYALTSITMTEGLEEIDRNSFKECRGLTEIIVPNSVTVVDASAFSMGQISSTETVENRPKLTKIVLGSGVTRIKSSGDLGNGFFGSGGSLGAPAENLTVLATTPPRVDSLEAFSARNTANFKIYVPSESLNAYKAAPVWGEMSSKIYPLS